MFGDINSTQNLGSIVAFLFRNKFRTEQTKDQATMWIRVTLFETGSHFVFLRLLGGE